MTRRYQAGPRQGGHNPPTRPPGPAQLSGLGDRHWTLLGLLAEHGALHTGQVVTLLFGSRPAAVRHLGTLVRAGLVWRFVHIRDPRHLAYYEASPDGIAALAQRLERAGRPTPPALGATGADMFRINGFFTRLAGDASGVLYRWWRPVDTVAWLARHGVRGVNPQAYGVWIEHGKAVRFLLHIDHDEPSAVLGTPPPPPGQALAGYRRAPRGVPVTGILVVTPTNLRERQLREDLTGDPVPVPVAATTRARLAASSPADAIWTITGTNPHTRVRLIGLVDR